jgi:hypothetical protein
MLGVLVLTLLLSGARAGALTQKPCNPDALCTGNPCTISAAYGLPDNCILNFGTRNVVVSGSLQWPNDTGIVGINAGTLALS